MHLLESSARAEHMLEVAPSRSIKTPSIALTDPAVSAMHLKWLVRKEVTVPVHLAHHLIMRASAHLLFHLTMGFALSVSIMWCSAMYCQCMAKAWPQNRPQLHEATGGDLLALAWSRPDNGTTYPRALLERTRDHVWQLHGV